MSLAGKGKESPPWWRDRIEHDPQAMPPLVWSAEPRAEGSEDSESVESERRRNPWGVDSDDLVTRFELYGYWEGSEESEEPAPEESGGPEPNTGVPSWFLGAPESYTGVPTMFERYGVHTDELPTYRDMGLELDSDCPELDPEDPWHPEVIAEEVRSRANHGI